MLIFISCIPFFNVGNFHNNMCICYNIKIAKYDVFWCEFDEFSLVIQLHLENFPFQELMTHVPSLLKVRLVWLPVRVTCLSSHRN